MARPARLPSYEDVITPSTDGARRRHRITRMLIDLAPGSVLEVPRNGDELETVRRRLLSYMRTATVQTGRRYHMKTLAGRLYAVCEDGD